MNKDENAKEVMKEIKELLENAGFELRQIDALMSIEASAEYRIFCKKKEVTS